MKSNFLMEYASNCLRAALPAIVYAQLNQLVSQKLESLLNSQWSMLSISVQVTSNIDIKCIILDNCMVLVKSNLPSVDSISTVILNKNAVALIVMVAMVINYYALLI